MSIRGMTWICGLTFSLGSWWAAIQLVRIYL